MLYATIVSLLASCDRTKYMYKKSKCCENKTTPIPSVFSQYTLSCPLSSTRALATTAFRDAFDVQVNGDVTFDPVGLYKEFTSFERMTLIDGLNNQIASDASAVVTEQNITLNGSEIHCYIISPEVEEKTAPVLLWTRAVGIGFQMRGLLPQMTKLANQTKSVVILPQTTDWHTPERGFNLASAQELSELVDYVANNADSLGVSKEKIAIGGDSIGAYFWAHTLFTKPEMIKLFIPFHANLDVEEFSPIPSGATQADYFITPQLLNTYAAQFPASVRNPFRDATHGQLTKFPTTLVFAAEYDLLAPSNVEFATRLMSAGIQTNLIYMKCVHHVFTYTSNLWLKETRYFIDSVASTMSLVMGG